jgi:transcriptional antiterminator NusG
MKEVKPEEKKEAVKPPEPAKEAKSEEPKEEKPQPVKQSKPRGQEPLPEPVEVKEIFAVKTSIGHEKIVADMIAARAKKKDAQVYAILSPQKLRGYVLIEGKGMERLRTLIKGLPKVRGVVHGDKSIQLDDILGQLEPTSTVEGINEGDIVELISGPFKGEKARVEQIDKSKEEITVALIEAIVKIPVTVKGEAVRILEKEKEEEK